MAAKFNIKTAKNGKFHFSFVAGNGQIVLSSEMYETKKAAVNGANAVKRNSGNDKRFEVKASKKGEPYFVLKSGNGQEIGKSQMYKSANGMRKGIKSIKNNAGSAEIVDLTGK